MTTQNTFAVLREALWCGEIGEREFIAGCAELGVSYDIVQATLADLRAEDGILAGAAA